MKLKVYKNYKGNTSTSQIYEYGVRTIKLIILHFLGCTKKGVDFFLTQGILTLLEG
jgi:hypothetical protein